MIARAFEKDLGTLRAGAGRIQRFTSELPEKRYLEVNDRLHSLAPWMLSRMGVVDMSAADLRHIAGTVEDLAGWHSEPLALDWMLSGRGTAPGWLVSRRLMRLTKIRESIPAIKSAAARLRGLADALETI